MTDKTWYDNEDMDRALYLIEKGFSKEDPIKLATRIHKSKENPDAFKDVDSDSHHWML
jgi:hypothetical protein